MKRKVYIPNLPTRFDEATAMSVPSIDLNPAAQFGELVVLTEGAIPESEMAVAIDTIIERIDEYEEQDYILCVGDVLLTAATIKYASEETETVSVLRWDRTSHSYNIVKVAL